MPRLSEMFPSKYLKAADFDERGSVLTIASIREEMIGHGREAEPKWVMYFREVEKGLVLNKVNTTTIGRLYGDNSDTWRGKVVTLYAAETQFKDDMVPAIRVRAKVPQPGKRAVAKLANQSHDDVGAADDDSREDVDGEMF